MTHRTTVDICKRCQKLPKNSNLLNHYEKNSTRHWHCFFVTAVGYIVPRFTIIQEKYEKSDEVTCSIAVVKKHLTLFEKLITTKITVSLGGYFNTADVYTLFGIRYANADVTCDEDPFQLDKFLW